MLFLTLFLEHVVRFLNLGFFVKPQRPAVEDFGHSVFNFLWSPGAEVLLREIRHVGVNAEKADSDKSSHLRITNKVFVQSTMFVITKIIRPLCSFDLYL